MKRLGTTICLLIFLGVVFAGDGENKNITVGKLNKQGVYLTYEDFVKGNIIEGEFIGIGYTFGKTQIGFKIKGKRKIYSDKDIWGCSDGSKFYRFEAERHVPVFIYMMGDVVVYLYYRASFNYAPDGTVTVNYPQETVPFYFSKDLNTPIIPLKYYMSSDHKNNADRFDAYAKQYLRGLKQFMDCLPQSRTANDVMICLGREGNPTISTGMQGYFAVKPADPK